MLHSSCAKKQSFMADIVFLCSDINVKSQRLSWSRILSSFDGFDAATSCPSLAWNCDFRRGPAGVYMLRLKTSIDGAHLSLKVSSNLCCWTCVVGVEYFLFDSETIWITAPMWKDNRDSSRTLQHRWPLTVDRRLLPSWRGVPPIVFRRLHSRQWHHSQRL